MAHIKADQDFLTVSELNHYVKDVINAGFPRNLWVCGEIQGYDRNRNKAHVFFELVEKDKLSQDVLARIGLVIFANKKFFIENVLKGSDQGFVLRDDIEVKFECRVDFYEPHGAVRLIVENIDPFYTLGKLAQERQKLIAELKEKGILDKNKVLEVPLVPLKIGLVTSDDSAAYNDFLSELKKSSYGFKVYLRNTIMQGKRCENDVISALQELSDLQGLDVIVITRGGGSLAELSSFDSEKIAVKISALPLPVLSGIGHEINTTVTDLAAHTYEKTPTAIAQFLVNRVSLFVDGLNDSRSRLDQLVGGMFDQKKIELKDQAVVLHHAVNRFIEEHQSFLIRATEAVRNGPGNVFRDSRRSLSHHHAMLARILQSRLSNESLKLKGYRQAVELSRPEQILKKGFTITRNSQGKAVTSAGKVKPGEKINIEFKDGKIDGLVTAPDL